MTVCDVDIAHVPLEAKGRHRGHRRTTTARCSLLVHERTGKWFVAAIICLIVAVNNDYTSSLHISALLTIEAWCSVTASLLSHEHDFVTPSMWLYCIMGSNFLRTLCRSRPVEARPLSCTLRPSCPADTTMTSRSRVIAYCRYTDMYFRWSLIQS